MNKLKGLAVLSAVGLLLSGCTAEQAESSEIAETVPVEKHLVVLGDSISAGYGLEDTDSERYSVLLTDMLNQQDEAEWKEYNYALSGDDSSDLLYRLEVGRAVRLPSADTIIICIGANNLLGVYTDYLESLVGDADVMNMTDEELDQLEADLIEQVQNDTDIYDKLKEAMDAGLVRLESDLEEIYTWIRERNATADIYVMNVYNPYADADDSMLLNTDIPMDTFAQEELDRCNEIIAAWEAAHPDLHAVDLAAAFAACDPIPIIGATEAGEADATYLDPHPNAEGHRVIADLLYDAITSK
mgnify:CR=1 FL=1